MDPYQTQASYGFGTPSNGGVQPPLHAQTNPFVPSPPPPVGQSTAGGDGINAFFSSAPTQFIGHQFVHGGQMYVQKWQERIGVFSGSILNYHFAISNEYVRKKLLVVLAPYLRRWNFSRLPEQIPGGPKFRAPRADVNCPDMYIPLMAFCSYCVFGCVKDLAAAGFTTDLMYTKVYRGVLGWLLHILAFKVLVYMMSMSSAISFVESACYTGYMFVLLTLQVMAGLVPGAMTWMLSWLYCSLSMGVFLVRSLKRLMHHEARHYGINTNQYTYLLLCLASFQFLIFYTLS